MRRRQTRGLMVATIAALGLLAPAGPVSANPVDQFCDGPKDGKAVVQRTVCPLIP